VKLLASQFTSYYAKELDDHEGLLGYLVEEIWDIF